MSNERPPLKLNLAGEAGNVFVVIGATQSLLTGQKLQHFNTEIGTAMLAGEAQTTYTDVLAIVNRYVELIDTSGLYAEYSRPRDEAAIMEAVNKLNEQLRTIPTAIYFPLAGLYPEFDNPDCGPEVYLTFVEQEIESVKERIGQVEPFGLPDLQRLKTALEECATSLRNAGV